MLTERVEDDAAKIIGPQVDANILKPPSGTKITGSISKSKKPSASKSSSVSRSSSPKR